MRGAQRTRGSPSAKSARTKASSEAESAPSGEGRVSIDTPASAAQGPSVCRVRAEEVAIARRTPYADSRSTSSSASRTPVRDRGRASSSPSQCWAGSARAWGNIAKGVVTSSPLRPRMRSSLSRRRSPRRVRRSCAREGDIHRAWSISRVGARWTGLRRWIRP